MNGKIEEITMSLEVTTVALTEDRAYPTMIGSIKIEAMSVIGLLGIPTAAEVGAGVPMDAVGVTLLTEAYQVGRSSWTDFRVI